MEHVVPGKVVAVCILYNVEGKMLLEHRSNIRKSFPGYWALFGGRIEEGEKPEQAVRREIKEELGYDLKAPVFLMIQDLGENSKKYVFAEQYDGLGQFTLDPYESQGYGWFTLEETKALKAISHDFEPLAQVAQYIKTNL